MMLRKRVYNQELCTISLLAEKFHWLAFPVCMILGHYPRLFSRIERNRCYCRTCGRMLLYKNGEWKIDKMTVEEFHEYDLEADLNAAHQGEAIIVMEYDW